MFESGIVFDLGQLLLDNEYAGIIQHFLRGVPVNEETLAVDLIDEIGPQGDYLAHPSTLEHARDNFVPRLFDRRPRGKWEADGAMSAYERATKEAERVLEEHHVEPLPSDVAAKIDALIADFDQ